MTQVSPSELEGVLFDHPAVLDVGVVGLPDESSNNKPKAFVVKKEGVEVTERQLCEFVAGEFRLMKDQLVISFINITHTLNIKVL